MSSTRTLVVGGSGLVGGALLRALGADGVGTYRTRPREGLHHLDAADALAVRRVLDEVGPAVVFFPAAEPNVDWCEQHPDDSYRQNVLPAKVALEATRATGARFAFFSSDYVFDGRDGPYAEGDAVAPLQVYGRHKLEVEELVLQAGGTVIRTTTVFGNEPPPAKNFVLRVIARMRAGERLRVPADQISTPTWADELAGAAIAVAARGGIWHVAGPQMLARDQFARMVAEVFGLDVSLIDAVPTSALAQVAPRPLRSGLRTEKLAAVVGVSLTTPREALHGLRRQIEA